MSKKFLKVINNAYKSVLMEQGPMPAPAGAPAPMPPPGAGAPMPVAGAPPTAPTAGGELTVPETESRSSSDTFLIGLIAKSLLINVDDDDKLKIIKYLKSLSEDSASNIEENLVNIINTYDYQNLDEDLDADFKIPDKKSRKVLKFLSNIMDNYIDTETKS
jgi:hypothetical protein